MFVTRILLDTFVDLATTTSKDCTMRIRIGHVEQNDVLHEYMALEVTIHFNESNETYRMIFKGYNMVRKAMEWAFVVSEGDFASETEALLVEHIERVVKGTCASK